MPEIPHSEDRPFHLDPTVVIAVLTLVGGIILANHEFQSPRPRLRTVSTGMALSDQRVDHGILDDPFVPLGGDSRYDVDQLATTNSPLANPPTKSDATSVLLVMIPGGPTSEDSEARLRARHAVVAGLGELRFAPDQPDRVGVWKLPWCTALELGENLASAEGSPSSSSNISCARSLVTTRLRSGAAVGPGSISNLGAFTLLSASVERRDGSTTQLVAKHTVGVSPNSDFLSQVAQDTSPSGKFVVPFEWFQGTRQTNSASVNDSKLVLWLDEGMFADRPLLRLGGLIDRLREGSGVTNYTVIGPYTSETLKLMVQEVAQERPDTNDVRSFRLVVGTPRAAVARLLDREPSPPTADRTAVVDALRKSRSLAQGVVDLGVNDAVLARSVQEELKTRGVDLDMSGRDHLVVVADATTMIGRSLPSIFADLLRQRQSGAQRPDSRTNARNLGATNLHIFTFLAGLDGGAMENWGSKDADDPGEGAKAARRGERAYDSQGLGNIGRRANLAAGANQLDSLERLARSIRDLDREIRLKSAGAIRAVVIGGGDIYDTLLVLRALRPELPHAVFATTELDARLWEPDQWEYTHNMVVVSGYGLELNADIQGTVGAFRDSRQTALFAATLFASGDPVIRKSLSDAALGPNPFAAVAPQPRTFEIGRHGPLDVQPVVGVSGKPSLHPESRRPGLGQISFGLRSWFGVLAAVVCLLAFFISRFLQTIVSNRFEHLAEPLWIRSEDLGGTRGVWQIRNALVLECEPDGNDHPEEYKSEWQKIHQTLREIFGAHSLVMRPAVAPGDQGRGGRRDPPPEGSPGSSTEQPTELRMEPTGVRYQPSEISDYEGLGKAFASERYRGFEATLMNGAPRSAGAGRKGSSSLVDDFSKESVVSRLNDLLDCLYDRGFDVRACDGGRAEFRESVWNAFLDYTQKPKRQFESTTLGEERSPLVEENQWIYCRMIVQEMFEDFLYQWNPYYLGERVVLSIANDINKRILKGFLDIPGQAGAHSTDRSDEEDTTVRDGRTLDQIIRRRSRLDRILEKCSAPLPSQPTSLLPADAAGSRRMSIAEAASWARKTTWHLFKVRKRRIRTLQGLLWVGAFALLWICFARVDVIFGGPGGVLDGTSIVPTLIGLGVAILLGIIFFMESLLRVSEMVHHASREFRMRVRWTLDPAPDRAWRWWHSVGRFYWTCRIPAVPEHQSPVDASLLWQQYHEKCHLGPRTCRIAVMMSLYFLAIQAFFHCVGFGVQDFPLIRGLEDGNWHLVLSFLAVFIFIGLAFWTVDSAMLCRWFIQCLTQGPTEYPISTLKMILDLRGQLDTRLVADYIDVKLIDAITRRIGTLLYFPATMLVILLVSYNTITYSWPWPWSWWGVVIAHFALASFSVVILQMAAREARDKSLSALDLMLYNSRVSQARPGHERRQTTYEEAQELIDELRGLRDGAFVGVANNPVLRAGLLPVAGTVAIGLLQRWAGG